MPLTPRFTDALVFTAELHRQQHRKVSGAPYLAHLLRVAGIVLEYDASEDEAIAALLHDAIEDQGGPQAREAIRQRFGEAVLEIVEGCTETDLTPKPPWRKRKEAHIAHVRTGSPAVRQVTAADKLDNARALLQEYRRRGDRIWEHFHGGRDGTLWYYREMLSALRAAGSTPLVEDFGRALAEIEREIGG